MTLKQMICLALSSTLLPPSVSGAYGREYFYYYGSVRQPLVLDPSHIAVLDPDGIDGGDSDVLREMGINGEGVHPHPIAGWHLVALHTKSQGAEQTETSVATIASRGRFAFTSPVFLDGRGHQLFMTSDIIVRFREGVTSEDVHAILDDLGGGIVAREDWVTKGMYLVRSRFQNGFQTLNTANRLAEQKEVLFAEPDRVVRGSSYLIPNDPLFASLWGLHNMGGSGGETDMDVDGPEAWDITTGDPGIVVAVLDTGVEQNHPDLNVVPGIDVTATPPTVGGGPVNACDVHGTAVAGCVSAVLGNSIGVVGLAPDCPVVSVRFAVSNLSCDRTWDSTLQWEVDAIDWAQRLGARVTVNSNHFNQSDAVDTVYATTRAAGVIHFASAGNDRVGTLSYPGSCSSVNSVAALNRSGRRASFSNWGTGLGFSAPGVDIVTTDRVGPAGFVPGDYVQVFGTSFAAPYAAAVAALILSLDPTLSPAQVEEIMQGTCVDLGDPGYDTGYGWGFVNAGSAAKVMSGQWVSFTHIGLEDGSFGRPYNSIAEALAQVPPGGGMTIKSGSTAEVVSISMPMTIRAFAGPATIGGSQ